MGFYAEIRVRYGREMSSTLKSWSSNNIKLSALRNRRVFLLECKRLGLHPKHMTNNFCQLYGSVTDEVSSRQAVNMENKVLNMFLKFEITVTITKIKRIEREVERLKLLIQHALPEDITNHFFSYQNNKYNRQFALTKQKNLDKVRALTDAQLGKVRSQERWVKNISGTNIPDRVLKFLSLGPKFSIDIPMKEISIPKLLSDVENVINLNDSLSPDAKNIKRAMATNIITNNIKPNKVVRNVVQREFYNCKRYLKEHPDLQVLQSDKGNVTVIMDKSQYIELSNGILNDLDYYRRLPRDPTTTIQTKGNTLIKKLVTSGHISQMQGKSLYSYNSIPARFYGLPKVHKPVLSLRPIISSLNTPTSKISGYISEIISSYLSVSRGRYYVEDSFSFSTFISEFQLPEDYVLISLDVVSLFTNISLELALSAIQHRWESISSHTTIPKEDFINIIRFLFNSNYFIFQGNFYNQILGSPMGSKFSPSIAEVVMDFLLDGILTDIPFEMPFIKKYVDDIICAVPSDKTSYTLERFNRQSESIKFTIELENNNSVPFLDTLVIRRPDNTLILDWYRKPSSSGRYLHYFSNHPQRQKINMVTGLKNRIQRISHPTLKEKNMKLLYQLMLENGYPKNLLKKLIHNSSNSGQPQNNDEIASTNLDQRIIFTSIPLINVMTKSLINLLKTDNIKVIPRTEFKLKRLYSNLKDRIETDKKSCVVYRIPCQNCDEVYIGQTSQQLKRRITQHISDIKNPRKICALAEHVRSVDHRMDYDSVTVLECEENMRKRCFLEMIHIKRHENSMNYRKDIENISNIYSYLIHSNQLSESELLISSSMFSNVS